MNVLESPTVTLSVVGEMEMDTVGVDDGLFRLLPPPQAVKSIKSIAVAINPVLFRHLMVFSPLPLKSRPIEVIIKLLKTQALSTSFVEHSCNPGGLKYVCELMK